MIEPTESESLQDGSAGGSFDRYPPRISAIERGEVSHGDNLLAHAPHSAETL